MNKRQLRETRQIEVVETHNLALSLKRLSGPPYDTTRWCRALYHALSMAHVMSRDELKLIREALGLA